MYIVNPSGGFQAKQVATIKQKCHIWYVIAYLGDYI